MRIHPARGTIYTLRRVPSQQAQDIEPMLGQC